MSDAVHVDPIDDDEHVIDGLGCWCAPRYLLPCDECGDMDGLTEIAEKHGVGRLHSHPDEINAPQVPGCWKCVNGLVELTRDEAQACEDPLVIVHNR